MSTVVTLDGSQGTTTTYEFTIRDRDAEVSLYSALTGSGVTVRIHTGAGWEAYTVSGSAKALDASNNALLIQAPGKFQVEVAASTPFRMHASTKGSVSLDSGF